MVLFPLLFQAQKPMVTLLWSQGTVSTCRKRGEWNSALLLSSLVTTAPQGWEQKGPPELIVTLFHAGILTAGMGLNAVVLPM